MTMRSWIRKVFTRSAPRPSAVRHFRPRVEGLENRLVPSSFTVSDNSDSATDPNSLRYALANLAAGSSASTNTITFAAGMAGQTITEASADGGTLTITQGVTLNGPAGGVTLDGGGHNSVFTVNGGVTASLSGLTITHGNAVEGGGIYAVGTLTVSNCTFANNVASGAVGFGGGIYGGATLNVSNCTFFDNSATANQPEAATAQGGGIFADAALNVSESTFTGNFVAASGTASTAQGGGIFTFSGATLIGNILVGNTANGGSDDINGSSHPSNSTNNVVGADGTGSLNTGNNTNNQLNVTVAQVGLIGPGNFGGSTQTFALNAGSVAIGAGTAANGITADQRGVPRTGTIDAGAYQYSTPATVTIQAGDVNDLITYVSPDSTSTINLTPSVYDFTQANNYWYGPDALPAISQALTINGNGAVLQRDPSLPQTTAGGLRFFFVSGGLSGLAAGSLSLENLTLQGGYAKGGNSSGGGGGLGAGGAIFNQGTLTLSGVTLTGNIAQGGNGGGNLNSSGGGGIGQDAQGGAGGGFGGIAPGAVGGAGGLGGTVNSKNGGGGGGFSASSPGTSGISGGAGGGLSGLGAGGHDGGNGAFAYDFGGNGGNFGFGGSDGGDGGAGGGVGGGGAAGHNNAGGGGGGFGGGGGSADGNFNGPGGGGFGGGTGGNGGGGGAGNGGSGMGGAIFSMYGSVTVVNSTFNANSVRGGNGGNTASFSYANGGTAGNGYGGAIFNLDGSVTLTNDTLAGDSVAAGTPGTGRFGPGSGGSADGGELFNLAYGNKPDGTAVGATATIVNSILANSTGGTSDLVNDTDSGQHSGTATVTASGPNFIRTSSGAGLTNTSANPLLSALGYYGGPTQTFALLPGSLAIGTGTATDYPGTSTPITTDQRGFGLDSPPDIGAYQTQSSPFLVTTATDPGQLTGLLSLREAVNLANAYSAAGDSADITFAPGISTITLTAGQLELTAVKSSTNASVTIDGGSAGVTVDGNQASRVLQADGNASATLNDLTITHGSATQGGGVYNNGTVTLTNCTVANNSATGSGSLNLGGGIFNNGTLTLTNSILADNSASGNGVDNNGGGILNYGALTLTNSTVANNSANGVGGSLNNGGGIYNYGGTLTLTNSTVANNSANGSGSLNNGGGIYNYGGTLTLTNSSFANNSASGNGDINEGGGIWNFGTLTLTNSTLANDSVSGDAINNGGGIYNKGGTLTLMNTIVAYSTGGDLYQNGSLSGSHNLIDDGQYGLSDTIVANPLLGSLGYYGGLTQTMPLLPGSPALNKGTTADYPGTSTPITTDQRGFGLDSPPDVGAYQTQSKPFLVTTATDPGQQVSLLSLREAVNLANAYSAAGDSADITFALGIRTITLTAGQLELTAAESNTTASVTVDGGSAGVTVDGNYSCEVFHVDYNVWASLNALTITHGNTSQGGGIYNDGTLTLTNSTLANNSASGGVYNYGGGIFNDNYATLTLTNCTLAYNSATGGSVTQGGGIVNDGTLTLTNSTLAYNSANGMYDNLGGGIDNFGTVTLTNSTLAYNSASGGHLNFGGGIFNNGLRTLSLTNTIVAYSTGGDIKGGSVNGSNNLVDDGSDGLPDTIVADPKLGSLGYYGGLTQTFALLPGSPALDAGSDTVTSSPDNLTTDQRGLPRLSGTHVDIGAFEAQVPTLTHFYVLYGNGLKYDLLGSTRLDVPWQITGIQAVFSTTVSGDSSSLSGFNVASFSGSGTTTLTWTFAAALADADLVSTLAGTGVIAITSSDQQALASGTGATAGTGFSQSVKVLYGDVNGDGVVNSTDIAEVQARILGKTVPVADIFLDLNGDGVIDTNDLTDVRNRSGHKLV